VNMQLLVHVSVADRGGMSRPPVFSIPSKPSRCRKHLEQRVEKRKTAVRGQEKLVKESTC